MPELTTLVNQRPQPKPRLSLLSTSSDDLGGNPLYQNLIFTSSDERSDQSSSSNGSLSQKEPKPKPRRRSLTDFRSLNEQKSRKERSNCGIVFNEVKCFRKKNLVLVYKDDSDNDDEWSRDYPSRKLHVTSAFCDFNFQCKRKRVEDINVVRSLNDGLNLIDVENEFKVQSKGNLSDDKLTIKCMPYNSPRLSKTPRGQNCTTMQGKSDPKTSSLPRATGTSRGNKLNVIWTTSSKNVPCRSERGAVSTLNQLRKPSFKKLEEVTSLKDNESTSSSNSSLSSLGDSRKRSTSLTNSSVEKRKSAAVPPQMVANLTSKFNALINESNPKLNSGANGDCVRKKINNKSSTLPTFQSCPSSPLRNLASKTSAIKQNKEVAKESKLTKVTSISRSTENVKGKDAGETKLKVQQSGPVSCAKKSSPVAQRKKSYVQQAVMNYEVTLSSSTSNSPEIQRRNSLPKRSFSISDETKNDSFASPMLLRRMLLTAAEARASKFMADCKHDGETRRGADTNSRINQTRQRVSDPQEMPKNEGGGTEMSCSSWLSRSSGTAKEGHNSNDGKVVKKEVVSSTTMMSTKLVEKKLVRQREGDLNNVEMKVKSEKAGHLSAGLERRCVSPLNSDNNKTSVSDVCHDGNKVKGTPPPLPTTQPRQINKVNLRRSASKETNVRKNNVNSTEKCEGRREIVDLELSTKNCQTSFLHSKLPSSNTIEAGSRESTERKSFEFKSNNHSVVDTQVKKESTLNLVEKKCENFKSSFLHSGNVSEKVESKGNHEQIIKNAGSPAMEKKLVIEKSNYVPNTSFLWREMKTTTTTVTTTVSHCSIPPPPSSAPPPIPEEFIDQNESNIYDDVISPCSEELYDEPLYSDANIVPHQYTIEDNRENGKGKTKVKDLSDKRELSLNNDSDEGWVDVSDTETEGNWHEKNASLSLNNRIKSGSKKNAAKRNSFTRRSSWCQPDVNKIDSSKIPMNSAPEEYADVSEIGNMIPFDDDFTDSDESNSTNPDHHYEALYELNQRKAKLEKSVNYVSESTEMLTQGSDCILEEESPEDLERKDFVSRSSLTIDANLCGEDKKEKRVKRNWSFRSDIRLEMASRLNKIRIKKTSTSANDVHSVEVCNDGKKSKPWSLKTRFTRKGSEPSSPTKKSPSPKKESALFYVPNCVTSDVTENSHSTSERPRAVISTDTNVKGPRRSSTGNVVRPKEAPPAPPVQAKPRADSLSSIDSNFSKRHLPSIPSDNELVQENDNYSRFSGSELNSVRSLDSDTESGRTRFSDSERKVRRTHSVSRSNSTVSSENERTGYFPTSPKTRTSIASTGSNSSNDSYTFKEDMNSSLLKEISELLKVNRDSTFSEDSNVTDSGKSSSEADETPPPLLPKRNAARNDKPFKFDDEPLYQFYTEDAHKRATQMNFIDASDDEYESIAKVENNPVLTSTTTAMDLLVPTASGHRSLWGDLREVRNSGILDTMTPQSRSLQEAMFEVVTSEASYLKSLNILVHHFMNCPEFSSKNPNCILTTMERRSLFSGVLPVKEVSEKLLSDLEKRWQENVIMTDICDIILYHAEHHFSVFVKYCSNQVYQERTLKELSEKNPRFLEVLKNLESSPKCQSLNMHSFLMLPMQRITRLPLLIDAIYHRLHEGTAEYATCQQALQKLNATVTLCNEGARNMARMEEMMVIAQNLKFRSVKGFPIISASRWLIKRGELYKLTLQDMSSKLGFVRRVPKHPIHVFLFTDYFVITKKRAENSYSVLDHCPRNMIQIVEINDINQLPNRPTENCKNIFKLTLLQNCEQKTVDLFLYCAQESDRARWIEAIQPKISENPDEKIYEEWDCPQVQVIHPYTAQQPDELSLEKADVLNVLKKVADGWYHGIRLRDGAQGWFPSNYTNEILSPHVRARNLRQRYRFIQCLEEQRRKDAV